MCSDICLFVFILDIACRLCQGAGDSQLRQLIRWCGVRYYCCYCIGVVRCCVLFLFSGVAWCSISLLLTNFTFFLLFGLKNCIIIADCNTDISFAKDSLSAWGICSFLTVPHHCIGKMLTLAVRYLSRVPVKILQSAVFITLLMLHPNERGCIDIKDSEIYYHFLMKLSFFFCFIH